MDGNMQKLKEQEESELCMYAQIKRFSTKDCHLTLFRRSIQRLTPPPSAFLILSRSIALFVPFFLPTFSPFFFLFPPFFSSSSIHSFSYRFFIHPLPSLYHFFFFFLTLPTSSTTFNNYIQRLVEEFCFNYQLHPTSFKSQPSTCIKSASFCPLSTYPFLSSFFSERVKRKKKKKEKTSQHCQ